MCDDLKNFNTDRYYKLAKFDQINLNLLELDWANYLNTL